LAGHILNLGEGNREGRGPWMEFGVDIFNVLNRVNFKDFIGVQTSPFFGRANAASPARELQFSMKYHF
jgi:hypothetical protein